LPCSSTAGMPAGRQLLGQLLGRVLRAHEQQAALVPGGELVDDGRLVGALTAKTWWVMVDTGETAGSTSGSSAGRGSA
jgi:hypothetical protein